MCFIDYPFLNRPKTLAWIVFAKSGWGKFQPINAPSANQNIVSNIVILLCCYLSGNGGCTGAALPPKPGVTGAPKLGVGALSPKLGAGVLTTGALKLGAGVVGAPNDGTPGVPLPDAAPAIFSCVRPNAAIPKTAPIAK
jgi:hypothetical protein